MKKLDRSRSFGQIFGKTRNGARFTQDDLEFNNEGNLCPGQKANEQTPAAEPRVAETKPPPEPAKHIGLDDKGNSVELDEAQADDGLDEVADQQTPVPIDDWPAPQVKKAVVDAGGTYTSKKDGIAFLKALRE